ncbi:hypothetical protein F5X96DRAFT_688284 [Biscogniauxia mediterranea]|nr:hypothetical protein F5X96DRAFT_688284 [Biscogniauxia mediterranea]
MCVNLVTMAPMPAVDMQYLFNLTNYGQYKPRTPALSSASLANSDVDSQRVSLGFYSDGILHLVARGLKISFGVGFGDLTLTSKLEWTVYKAYKDSGDNFKRLSSEVSLLHVVLKGTEDYLGEFESLDTSRIRRLKMLTDSCHEPLKDLEKMLNPHDRLGTQIQGAWDRFRFGSEDFAEIRSRPNHRTCGLSYDGSWKMSGSYPTVMEENHEFISSWMKLALSQGLVDEDDPTHSKGSIALLSDSGYGGSISFSTTALNAANEEFEEDMRRKQAGRPIEEIFKRLTVETSEPPSPKKSLMGSTRLLRKLFQKSTALVQAEKLELKPLQNSHLSDYSLPILIQIPPNTCKEYELRIVTLTDQQI